MKNDEPLMTCASCKYWDYHKIEISASMFKRHKESTLAELVGSGVARMIGCCRRYPRDRPLFIYESCACGEHATELSGQNNDAKWTWTDKCCHTCKFYDKEVTMFPCKKCGTGLKNWERRPE